MFSLDLECIQIRVKLELNYIFPPQENNCLKWWNRGSEVESVTLAEELQMETPGYKHLRIVLKCKTSLNIHFLRASPAEGGEWGSAGESKWSQLLEFTAVINSGMWSDRPGSCDHTAQKWARKKIIFNIPFWPSLSHKSEARAWIKGFINDGASQVIKQGGNAERQSDQRQEPGLTHGEF